MGNTNINDSETTTNQVPKGSMDDNGAQAILQTEAHAQSPQPEPILSPDEEDFVWQQEEESLEQGDFSSLETENADTEGELGQASPSEQKDFSGTTSLNYLYEEPVNVKKESNHLDLEAKTLFGEMREATVEESESVQNYIRSISKNTGSQEEGSLPMQQNPQANTEEPEYLSGLLCEYDYTYTKQDVKKYLRAQEEDLFARHTLILCGVLLIAGLTILIWKHTWGVLVAALIWAALSLGFPPIMRAVREWKFFQRNRVSWDAEKHICIYDDKITMESSGNLFQFVYDDFYKFKEGADSYYLVAGSRGTVILPKNVVPRNIIAAIWELFEEEEEE